MVPPPRIKIEKVVWLRETNMTQHGINRLVIITKQPSLAIHACTSTQVSLLSLNYILQCMIATQLKLLQTDQLSKIKNCNLMQQCNLT